MQNKLRFIFISEVQPAFDLWSKVVQTERNTKRKPIFLFFFEKVLFVLHVSLDFIIFAG